MCRFCRNRLYFCNIWFRSAISYTLTFRYNCLADFDGNVFFSLWLAVLIATTSENKGKELEAGEKAFSVAC